MKLVLTVCRKEGRPGYSSEGATAEVHLEVSEATISANPLSLIEEARRGYALLDQVVTEQLGRTAPAAAAEPASLGWVHGEDDRKPVVVSNGNGIARGNGEPIPARSGLPSQGRPPSAPEPARQEPRRPADRDADPRSKPNDGAPKDGRQLVPWARKREQSGQFPGLFRRLVAYGRSQNFPEMMTAWSYNEVNMAVSAVLGAGYDDEPEPEPASRNGYHNGNGYR
jgi:hypothetical protein